MNSQNTEEWKKFRRLVLDVIEKLQMESDEFYYNFSASESDLKFLQAVKSEKYKLKLAITKMEKIINES